MRFKNLLSKEITKKLIYCTLLLIVALLSVFVISKFATSPENYRSTIQSIDEKKAAVMGITATAATTSTALAAVPGEATTPIANQIMQISEYLMIVVCILVLEKSLLTVMGYLSFNILIPIACVLLGIYVFVNKEKIKILAVKFIVFAVVIVTIIPFSLKISDMIYEVNKSTIEQVEINTDEKNVENMSEEDKSWIDKSLDSLKDTVSNVGEKAKQIMNTFIDTIALFIITYCAIPIIVIFIVIWFIKFLFGIAVPIPKMDKISIFKKKNQNEKTGELLEENK